MSAAEGVREIDVRARAGEAAALIRRAFAPVAEEFGLTPGNCPAHPSFTTAEALAARLAREGCFGLALERGGALVGFVGLTPAGEGAYEATRLAVESCQQRHGIGGALLEAAADKARALGARRVVIGIIDGHTKLKDWYLARGFTETARSEYPHLPFAVCHMERRV